jgi:hypothetical protein
VSYGSNNNNDSTKCAKEQVDNSGIQELRPATIKN